MARIKLAVFALLALGLVGWNYMAALSAGSGAPPSASSGDPKAAGNQLAANAAAVNALVAAQQAGQQAAAHVALTSEPLVGALAAVAKEGAAPSAEQAKPLTEAAEKALAELPEATRKYVVVALATAQGGLAVVPGHDPLLAGSFPWIDEARKAGAAGKAAEVAGKKVLVFAAPVRAVVKDEVKDLGTLAIAFGREPADLAGLIESSAVPVTLVAGGSVVASSDKAHSAEAAGAKGPGEVALKGAAGKALELPGYEGALAVVSASAGASSAAAPAASGGAAQLVKNLQISLGVLGLASVVFIAIMGSGGAPAPREEQAPPQEDVRVEPASLRNALEQRPATPPPAPEPLEVAPSPEPEPEPIMASGELLEDPAPMPVLTSPTSPTAPAARAAPPPQPEADRVPGFDELFGGPPPAPREATRPAVAAAPPPPPLPMPPPAPPQADPMAFLSEPAPVERTSTMSREMVAGLQAQSSRAEAIPLPGAVGQAAIPLPGSSMGAIPLPSSVPISNQAIPLPSSAPDPFALAGGGGESDDQPHERTVVAAIPQELLRAATPQARPGSNGPGVAGAMGAANAEELHFQDVYREFLQVRKRCGEPDENLTFEKFAAKLRKNKDQLVQKYACKSVRFQVYVKEGKAALKATPVKEA